MTGVGNVDELVRGLERLSSPPVIFMRIQEAVNNPRSSVQTISRIISEDQGLTAQLLRLANSPLYRFPSRIETISEAITIVGTQQICDLALATSVMKLFTGIPEELVDMDSFWCHSISCGLVARTLSTYRRESNVERFFVAGILHDIGRLVMYTKIPEVCHEGLIKSKDGGDLLYEVERQFLGFDHGDAGGSLLREWRLPQSIGDMVKYHHNPSLSVSFPVETAVVHVSDIIAHAMQLGTSGECFVPALDVHAWGRLELSPGVLSPTLNQVDIQFAEATKMLLTDSDR